MRIILIAVALLFSACATGRVSPEELTKRPVSDAMLNEAFFNEFTSKVCGKAGKKMSKKELQACGVKLDAAIEAKLAETYPFADGGQVRAHCTANPLACLNTPDLEGVVRANHFQNSARYNEYQRALASQRASESLRQLNQQLNPPKTKCTSRANIFGGQDMQCQ
jgi:hypothetical protein